MASNSRNPVVIVQGAQWGSEAKGNIAAKLCVDRNIDIAIRTGAINAGHTVWHGGVRYAMQQLPTGWVNPNTVLVIGPGAYIHPDTLWREVDEINAAMPGHDVRDRLLIDYRCGIHDEAAEGRSKEANRHHKIGATGKGCSEAIVAKIRDRNDGYELFANTWQGKSFRTNQRGKFIDTVSYINASIDKGAKVLIEGTQGTFLDLHLGPYPFTTSRMTTAANWIAEAGLSPNLDYEVVLVARTFPIRVAGNSGPMADEIEWLDLAIEINTKLHKAGLPDLVSATAMNEFNNNLKEAVRLAAESDRYQVPSLSHSGRPNHRCSTWKPEDRSVFRVAASELNKDALNLCSPETLAELRKLFEMTTVTKKLRRIARLNIADLQLSIAINRPSWIALTFLDYVVPQMAEVTQSVLGKSTIDDKLEEAMRQAAHYVGELEAKLRVPIRMVSTGPQLDHVFSTTHIGAPSER